MANVSEEARRLLVVAHGDLDGIVSAVLVASTEQWSENPLSAEVVFVQPFTLDKVEVADDDGLMELFVWFFLPKKQMEY